jgi:hypothetical protein
MQEIETSKKEEEAIGVDHLFAAKSVVGETAAYHTTLVHTLYSGMEAFGSGVDNRVSGCVDVHMLDLRVPRYQPVGVSDFVAGSVDGLRILERTIGLIVRLVDNFLPRGGRQIYNAVVRKQVA